MNATIPCAALAQSALIIAGIIATSMPTRAMAAEPMIGERPAVTEHLDQNKIESGYYSFNYLKQHGQLLFDARFNLLDGQGRPTSTGTGAPRLDGQPEFIRTSGPDSNSCSGCHAQPFSGGAGDFVANVFVLAQALDPVTTSVDGAFSNERNTLGMFGAGAIEMLAREMTAELVAIREAARESALANNQSVTVALSAKGVSFGMLTVQPDGLIDPTGIEGVDWDLIIKPFHQKGAVVSLREFSNNAMNHHHGIQSAERFGAGIDADSDGVTDELTVGDITAVTIFQAALPAPQTFKDLDHARTQAINRGEATFGEIGCNSCHRPELELNSRYFSEPNPYNPSGNLRPQDTVNPVKFDLVKTSKSSLVKPNSQGKVSVKAFTDLKRHNLNDADFQHFNNEQVPQGLLTGFAPAANFTTAPVPRPTGAFLTRKLWDAGNSDPYGHRGDLTTLTEAIWFHGGEARTERDRFFNLPEQQQAELIEFLKSMVVTR